MAVISKGITLSYKHAGSEEWVVLTNLQEIPELGGEAEAVEITTLADAAHTYTNGILNYGDSLAFKFLYEHEQFISLCDCGVAGNTAHEWRVKLPDSWACTFGGVHSVKLDGVGVNSALTYTLTIRPTSQMVWEADL